MNIYHQANLQEAIDGMKKIFSISWSANLMRLAIAHVDDKRSVRISLYDENGEKKDSFLTKPANKTNKSYVVRDIAFSPDSIKLAVSQSDSIVFVYYLGPKWAEKKTICNKFEQTSQVSCLVWPSNNNNELYFGVAEGKVKAGNLRTNLAQVLYSTESYIVSLDCSIDGKFVISGHIDNSIYKYSIESNQLTKILQNSCIPYCVGFGQDIVVAGNNGKICFYSIISGEKKFEFDYTGDSSIKDFTCCKFNSNGDAIILGNYNRFMVFYKKKESWVEVFNSYIENLYTVTSVCWKPDSSAIVVGNLCGSVDIFESCLRKTVYKNKFEISFISESLIMIKNLETNQRVNLNLTISSEVEKISIQKENFVIVTTKSSLLIGNIQLGAYSELEWELSGDEVFEFSNDSVCLIVLLDEIYVIEYGKNSPLGSFKSNNISKDLISIRLFKSSHLGSTGFNINLNSNTTFLNNNTNVKTLAYLIDSKTINFVNLINGTITASFIHNQDIISLELNFKGDKLIFLDNENSLYILSLDTTSSQEINYVEEKKLDRSLLVRNCSFFKIVNKTNIIVAMTGNTVFIWYCADDLGYLKKIQTKGSSINIVENQLTKEIQIEEIISTNKFSNNNNSNSNSNNPNDEGGNKEVTTNILLKLDQQIIDIYHMLETGNLKKAIQILESKDIYINNSIQTNNINTNNQLRTSKTFLLEKDNEEIANNQFKRSNSLLNINNNVSLETNSLKNEYYPLWDYLAKQAISNKQLYLAMICYGRLNNFMRMKYLKQIINDSDKFGSSHPLVEAKLSLLEKNFNQAEAILLKNNLAREAFELFWEIKNFQLAYDIAQRYKFNDLSQITEEYIKIQYEKKDFEKVAVTLASNGRIQEAIKLLIDKGLYLKLCDIIFKYNYTVFFDSIENKQLIDKIEEFLEKNNLYSYLSKFNELQGKLTTAIEYLIKTKDFANAKRLSYQVNINHKDNNNSILSNKIEVLWGDYLFELGDYDLALTHYLDGKESLKAIEVAIKLKKINQVLELTSKLDSSSLNDYFTIICKKLSTVFKLNKEYPKAESMYLLSNDLEGLIHMYCEIGKFNELNLTYNKLKKPDVVIKEIKNMLSQFSKLNQMVEEYITKDIVLNFEDAVRSISQDYSLIKEYNKAENLLVMINETDLAIQMYKNTSQYEKMIDLVKKHRREYLQDTYYMTASLIISKLESEISESGFKKLDSSSGVTYLEENTFVSLNDKITSKNKMYMYISRLSENNRVVKNTILTSIEYYLLSGDYIKASSTSFYYLGNISKSLGILNDYLNSDEFKKNANENAVIIIDNLLKYACFSSFNSNSNSNNLNSFSGEQNNEEEISMKEKLSIQNSPTTGIIVNFLKEKQLYIILVHFLCGLKNYSHALSEVSIISNNVNSTNEDPEALKKVLNEIIYSKLAEEHRENKEFDKAEEMYIRGFKYKDALNMYIENEEFENAMRIAKIYLDKSAIEQVNNSYGYYFIRKEKYDLAEKIFLKINQPEAIIELYLNKGLNEQAKSFVERYLPERVQELDKIIKNNSSTNPLEFVPVKESYINPNFTGTKTSFNYANNSNSKDGDKKNFLKSSNENVLKFSNNMSKNNSNNDSNTNNFKNIGETNNLYSSCKSKNWIETLRRTRVQSNSEANILFLAEKFEKFIQEESIVDAVEYILAIQSIKIKINDKDTESKSNNLNKEVLSLNSHRILDKAYEIVIKNSKNSKLGNFERQLLLEEIASRYLKLKDYKLAAKLYSDINTEKGYEKAILSLIKGNLILEAQELLEQLNNKNTIESFSKDFLNKLKILIEEKKQNPLKVNDLNAMIKEKDYLSLMMLIKNFSDNKEIYDGYLIKICSSMFNEKQFFSLCEFLLTVDVDFTPKLIDVIKSLAYEILAEENLSELEVLKFVITKYKNSIYSILKSNSTTNEKLNDNDDVDGLTEFSKLEEASHYQYFKYLINFHKEKSKIFNLEEVFGDICFSLLRYGDIIKFDLVLYDAYEISKKRVSKIN